LRYSRHLRSTDKHDGPAIIALDEEIQQQAKIVPELENKYDLQICDALKPDERSIFCENNVQ
jgi:hypothetical protein